MDYRSLGPAETMSAHCVGGLMTLLHDDLGCVPPALPDPLLRHPRTA